MHYSCQRAVILPRCAGGCNLPIWQPEHSSFRLIEHKQTIIDADRMAGATTHNCDHEYMTARTFAIPKFIDENGVPTIDDPSKNFLSLDDYFPSVPDDEGSPLE